VDFRDSSQILRESPQEAASICGASSPASRAEKERGQSFFWNQIAVVLPVSKEEFQSWFKTGSRFPLAIKGHTFALSRDGLVKVDGGKFIYEEALQLVLMLNSRNPFTQINASLIIWERNGVLRFLVIALLVIVAAAVLVIARR
jgi:hypothetical protein